MVPIATDHTVILHDETSRLWLRFRQPETVLTTGDPRRVTALLAEIERQVDGRGRHAAGFLSYTAAPALDPFLKVSADGRFPLLWFGIYREPEALTLPAPPASGRRAIDWRPSVSDAEYRAGIDRIKDYIHAGDTYQVNYTFRLRAPAADDPWDLFLRMSHAQGRHLAAYIDTGDWCVCSASHELFFRLDGEILSARPMKGTAARGPGSAEDERQAAWLQASAKNRAENLMIVDMLRNDMGRIAATGSVSATDLFRLEKYPTLWQMTSRVSCRTRASFSGILRALFPCASITGAPKRRTMEIIHELESTPRNLYTGAIGYLAPGRRAQFSVAIRTAVIDKRGQGMEYGTGGGIVWDSDSGAEMEECLAKARILTRAAPEFDLLETLLWTPRQGCHLLDGHLDRLAASAAYFSRDLDLDAIRRQLAGSTRGLPALPHRLRLLVGADGEPRVEVLPLPGPRLPYRAALARAPVDTGDVFLYHKTTHRRLYEDALAQCPGCDDVLLWNEKRQLTESCIANLVLDLDGELVTPPEECGLLPGVYRAGMLRQGTLRERIVTVDQLPRCRAVYLANSVRGLWPVEVVSG